ncbi:tetratricopeptide (TPR) repeat protein [Catenulispora sp. GP43]|uniref:hypothetical protein n=1 Tax=Catenulispora sp. GP43 TaxID=3156263 RepID=UPI0035113D18
MPNGDFGTRDNPDAVAMAAWTASGVGALDEAVTAARQAVEDDPDDWRRQLDLVSALAARHKRMADLLGGDLVREAVAAARRAVALAPDEPEAHLALADALRAVWPRRITTRLEAFAEIDKAELLGMDQRDLAERRAGVEGGSVPVIISWPISTLFFMFGIQGVGGGIGRVIADVGFVAFAIAARTFRARAKGQSLRESLDIRRRLHRKRLATDEQMLLRAPAGAAVLTILVFPGAALAIPGAEKVAQSSVASYLLLAAIAVLVPAIWIGVDRWLRPGTVVKALRHDVFTAVCVPITLVIAPIVPVLVLLRVHSSGLWFSLFLGPMAWMVGVFIWGMTLTSRRKKAAQ